eukprot:TRINITY_DN402_c2_g1_i1.p1 TRINITY_DN402_c2_g1~~TRINITY_DN402_c2_g1_i1.p1  ORF type:complete len:496 (-),score=223.21 TRINITY_DN402_c2_g1_i1:156-1643(-)
MATPEKFKSLPNAAENLEESGQLINTTIQLKSVEGELTGPQLLVPIGITPEQLEAILNELLSNEEKLPYSFFIDQKEIISNLDKTIKEAFPNTPEEQVIEITYQPQAIFRIKAVTRCSSSMSGHSEAVLSVSFSPDGNRLASGSGDTTIRLWDMNTETPMIACRGHSKWVLCVAWSPDGVRLGSGSMDNQVRVWDGRSGRLLRLLKGHTKWITSIAWEPLHLNSPSIKLASGSKDGTVRIWDVRLGTCSLSLSGHTAAITCVKWSGEGLIYTASEDRTIKVFTANEGKLIRTLSGHGHWVNTLAIHTDYALRTGAFDENGVAPQDLEQAKQAALVKYQKVKGSGNERLVSGSDDHTMYLWEPGKASNDGGGKNFVCRMTGHQQPVNIVAFSPDGLFIASASFDKSIKLWNGINGTFIATFRGHVGAVYQIAWSADSRLLVSGSKDSTMKLWDMKTRRLKSDLPGHADEVFSVDWSPDGERVASGSKDRIVKIWRN